MPVRDGRAYAELDLTAADSDLFIGHPLVADNPAVKLLVNWQEPGPWFAEAHNPTNAPLTARLTSAPGGPLAHFRKPSSCHRAAARRLHSANAGRRVDCRSRRGCVEHGNQRNRAECEPAFPEVGVEDVLASVQTHHFPGK